jgi:hypothetical protein
LIANEKVKAHCTATVSALEKLIKKFNFFISQNFSSQCLSEAKSSKKQQRKRLPQTRKPGALIVNQKIESCATPADFVL